MNKNNDKKIDMSAIKEKWQELYQKTNKDRTAMFSLLNSAYVSNPYIQNKRVKSISSKGYKKSLANIREFVDNPADNEKSLREVSTSLFSNYPMLKMNHLYADILTYRNYFYAYNLQPKDVKTNEYKKERQLLNDWVKKLNPERTFRNITLALQREGKKAYYIRNGMCADKKKVSYVYLQELPSDYFKITGLNTTSVFTVSFDFTYFWQPGTSVSQFPPIFAKYFEECNNILKNRNNSNINPNKIPTNGVEIYNQGGSWHYWKELPVDECFVFSQDETLAWQVPNSIGLFIQAENLQDYLFLQQELLEMPLNAVVMGTLPMHQNDGIDEYAIGTEAYEFFTNMFNDVAPKGVQLFLTPATNHEFFKFDSNSIHNSEIVKNALHQFNSFASIGGLNPITDKPQLSQVKSQQVLEAAYVDKVYKQFEQCINVFWEKLNFKYKWRFIIKGSRFKDDSDYDKIEKALSLGQNYLLPEFLSFHGLNLDDAKSIQLQVKQEGVYDNFETLVSAFNTTQDKDKKNGRPTVKDEKIESENTGLSKEQGSNTSDGRVVNMTLKHCVECGENLNEKNESYPFCSLECKSENEDRLGG